MAIYLGEYQNLRLIGNGAFATIRKVRHAQLGYVRALKVLKDDVEDEQSSIYQTFLKECRVLLKIGNGCHPNIVRIYQPRLLENKALVEMDYVEGSTLGQFITKDCDGFVPYVHVERFIKEIVGALAYCHVDIYHFLMSREDDNLEVDPSNASKFIITPEKRQELIKKYGVTHNDLHSNNIMRRDYDGSFILLDFGLAIAQGTAVKSSSRRDGAVEYRPPEKWDDIADISPRSDVYSLGVLLYELLAGRVPFPFEGTNASDLNSLNKMRRCHCETPPQPIEPLRKQAFENANQGKHYKRDYPHWLDEIVMRCLEKDPLKRYANAKELLDDFNRHHDLEVNSSVNVLELRQALADSSEVQQRLRDENESLKSALKNSKSGAVQPNPAVENELQEVKRHNAFLLNELQNRNAEITALRAQPNMNKGKTPIIYPVVAILAIVLSALLGIYALNLRSDLKKLTESNDSIVTVTDKDEEITNPKKQFEKGEQLEREKNFEEAAEWYRKAAEQGNVDAQVKLGNYYSSSTSGAKNDTEAFSWLLKAANAGNATAQYRVGDCYENGKGTSKDYAEAVEWYRKAAEKGSPAAQYCLAKCYREGNGVSKDDALAVSWYRKSAEQGNANAQNGLGYCYQYGYGVSKDVDEAVKWYKKAVAQGNSAAQNNLGYCYTHGEGVELDYSEAMKLYRKAAEKGNASAQCNIGYLYDMGYGVEQNYKEAEKWYQKAVENGNKTAQGNLERLREKM